MSNVWGPLGNPTKEEIQKWCELPYGKFTSMVKERRRKKHGKTMSEHTLYVMKEISNLHMAEIKVWGFDLSDAMKRAPSTFKELEYSEEPVMNRISYSMRTVKPLANAK